MRPISTSATAEVVELAAADGVGAGDFVPDGVRVAAGVDETFGDAEGVAAGAAQPAARRSAIVTETGTLIVTTSRLGPDFGDNQR